MGRIKTTLVKRITLELIEKHRDKFDIEFSRNKEVVSKLVESESKKMRNIVAGYVTRIMRKGDKFLMKSI